MRRIEGIVAKRIKVNEYEDEIKIIGTRMDDGPHQKQYSGTGNNNFTVFFFGNEPNHKEQGGWLLVIGYCICYYRLCPP